jgi:hypothetical protein
MGDLGANLAGIFDAEDAEGAEEEETFPFEEPLQPGGEEEIFNRGVTGGESKGDNLQETQKTAGEPPAHAPSRTHQDSALLAALNNIIAHNSKDNTKQDFDWQPSYGHDNRNTFKEEVLAYHPNQGFKVWNNPHYEPGKFPLVDGEVPGLWSSQEEWSRAVLFEFLDAQREFPPVQECMVRGLLQGSPQRPLPGSAFIRRRRNRDGGEGGLRSRKRTRRGSPDGDSF